MFLTELLERNATINPAQQACVLGCLQALLAHIDFGDTQFWSFINEELMRHVCKCLNTQPSLFADALELVKLTVSKSSSLINISNSRANAQQTTSTTSQLASSNSPKNNHTTAAATPITMHNFFNRKELPGRTLEFDFDFGIFTATSTSYDEPNRLRKTNSSSNTQAAASNNNNSNSSSSSLTPQIPPMLNLLSLHAAGEQFNMLNQYTSSGHHLMNHHHHHHHHHHHNLHGGWKRPALSKPRTRERIYALLNTIRKQHSTQTLASSTLHHPVHTNTILEEPQQQQQQQPAEINFSSMQSNNNTTTGLIDEHDPLSSTLNQSTTSTSSSSGMMSPPQPPRTLLENADLSTSKHSSSTNTTSSSSLAVSPNPGSGTTTTQKTLQNKSATTTTSSSSSSLSYNNRTSASNNSLNQTSFVASPEATPTVAAAAAATTTTTATVNTSTFKEKSPSPIIAPKPSGSMINNLIASFNQYSSANATSANNTNGEKKFELPHHTRKNSMSIIKSGAIVGGGPSIVSIVNTGSSGNISALSHGHNPTPPVIHQPVLLSGQQHKSTTSISSMKLLQQGGSVEIDNNFINNTFSFLDDLDQDGETPMFSITTNANRGEKSEPVNNANSRSSENGDLKVVNSNTAIINVNSNTTEDTSDSNNEINAMMSSENGNNSNNNDYENFPWHAIYPATDSNSTTDSSSQLNLSKIWKFYSFNFQQKKIKVQF